MFPQTGGKIKLIYTKSKPLLRRYKKVTENNETIQSLNKLLQGE